MIILSRSDQSGGFWNERWGDAPVHSLAAGLFLEPEQIHYFEILDIGILQFNIVLPTRRIGSGRNSVY